MTLSQVPQLLMQQSWQVALLASIVLVLTRYGLSKRAHLSHMLWALVLIKCITPPIWSSPIGFFSRLSEQMSIGREGVFESNLSSSSIQKRNWSKATLTIKSELQPGNSLAKDKSTARTVPGASNLTCAATLVWLVGVCVMMMLSFVRSILFLREVRLTSCESPPEVSRCVQRLNKRLGLRRRVRVCIVTSTLGPAVFGLLRPVILLPKAIIAGRTPEQLEPLIAHEMIHFRRGDLWLALVQSIACNIGWFHPMVWLASRQLTIESERCCDEETIASLPCKPAAYARSLLEVLELKHQLRIASALP